MSENDKMPTSSPHQRFWFWVVGYDKPLASLTEALGVVGLKFGGGAVSWSQLPASVKSLIRVEKIPKKGSLKEATNDTTD